MNVYVLMTNDYPHSVYDNEEVAARVAKTANDGEDAKEKAWLEARRRGEHPDIQRRIFYHVHAVPMVVAA